MGTDGKTAKKDDAEERGGKERRGAAGWGRTGGRAEERSDCVDVLTGTAARRREG